MAGRNEVFQKVSLDNKDYIKGLKGITAEQRETTARVAKLLQENSRGHHENAEAIKKKNLSIIKSLREVGKAFTDNLKKGTVVAGSVAAASALKTSYNDAARSLLGLDKGMARLISRYDISREKAKNLRKEISLLATQTGVTGGALATAAEELMSASGSKKSPIGINSIAKYSAMGGGDPAEIARMTVDYLKGSGQQFTDSNVEDFLRSAMLANRGGDLSLSESLKSLTVDSASKAKLGLSNKENAALIAAASGVGQDRGTSVAGLNALLGKSVGGLGEGAALSGILGVKGGFLSGGKFDISKLRSASQNLNSQGLKKADFTKLMESSGLSSTESEGLFSILKDFNQFEKSFQNVLSDQKSLEDGFGQATDNLSDSFSRLNEKLAKGTQEILAPAGEALKHFVDGDITKGVKRSLTAIPDTIEAALDNKAAVGMGLAGLALTGAITTKLGGLLGGGTAQGLAVDKLTSGAVKPVYVVNIKELGSAMGGSGLGSTLGGVAAGGAGASILSKVIGSKAFGLLVKGGIAAAPLGLAAAGTTAAGAVGYGLGNYVANPLLDKFTTSKTKDGFEGNAVERLIYSIDKMTGIFGGAEGIRAANKIELEVIDRGDRFTARPSKEQLNQNNVGM